MKIVAWGNQWKVVPDEGPAKKFPTEAEAKAWAEAMEGGAQTIPGTRDIEVPKKDWLDDFEDSLEAED